MQLAWHTIPNGPDQDVTVRFAPLVDATCRRSLGIRSSGSCQATTVQPEFHVRVAGLDEISWWILGYGDQAEVLKPLPLRQLIAERAQRLVNLYNGDA